MLKPSEVTEAYIRATGRGDITTVRNLLSTEKFSFVGPIERLNNAEDPIKSLEKLGPMITGVDIRKTFVDRQDVACIYNLKMKAPMPEVRCTELCRVDNEKITSTEIFFDASPFREMERRAMTKHMTGTHEEWLAARLGLLKEEKELTRRSDELARRRQELPWVQVDKEYRFETDEGSASLADLFRGRSQLLVYHFMFGPDYTAGCPSCSAIADGFDGFVVHLANHDVTISAVSRAPLAKLQEYKRRMGWTFPWASSLGSDFNFDFNVSFTEEQQNEVGVEYNYRRGGYAMDAKPVPERVAYLAATSGTDAPTYSRDRPGMSAFVLEDGVVYHTYSTYARGLDGLWGMYQWLDRSPKGRNETGVWWRRHDEYDKR